MWPRVCELVLAAWLAASPLVFARSPGPAAWGHDLLCAAAIALAAGLSFHARLRRAHLLELLVAGWLVVHGYLESAGLPRPGAAQNHLAIGLTLLLLAVLPSDASQPPAWRRRDGAGGPAAHPEGGAGGSDP